MKNLISERHPVYAGADLVIDSRDEPHDVIVGRDHRHRWPNWPEPADRVLHRPTPPPNHPKLVLFRVSCTGERAGADKPDKKIAVCTKR